MQKLLFSAPDGPAGPGTREIHLVTPPARSESAISAVSGLADASANASASTDASVKAESAAPSSPQAPAPIDASKDSTAPALVWPPTDEELDDWHVIPLVPPAAAAAKGGGAPGAAGGTGTPKKPLPVWLANHRAAKSGTELPGESAAAGSHGSTPRVMTSSPSGGGIRAVSASSLEDTARFPSETTTAIAALRKPSTSAGGNAPAVAVNLAQAAQPAAPRPVAAFPTDRRRMAAAQPAASLWNGAARRTAVVVLALLAVGQAAYIGSRLFFTPAAASTSVLTVDSVPDGAEVFIDGERRGLTPFKVELTAGSHALQLRKDGRTRTIPLVLAAGVQASQYVELGNAAPSASAPSASSAPSTSSAVTPRQGAPSPSSSPASPTSAAASASATGVTGTAGGAAPSGTATPDDGIAAPAPADAATAPPVSSRGYVVIETGGLNLRVLRNGEMLGSSEEGRLALPAGRQELELVNDAVGYRSVMTVQVPPGRAVSVPVELPQSLLNVSATPAARVWIDGREIGTTPIRQLALSVGQHEVRFEHPEHGERRMTVLVRVGATAQASVDFTR
jgi:hypothetical protein